MLFDYPSAHNCVVLKQVFSLILEGSISCREGFHIHHPPVGLIAYSQGSQRSVGALMAAFQPHPLPVATVDTVTAHLLSCTAVPLTTTIEHW